MNKNTLYIITLTILANMIFFSCATSNGDSLDCPECDNLTELLVGDKCVPIADIEECGPDGHSHGTECHCFNGQDITEINGKEYCLQTACSEQSDGDTSEEEDIDQHACEHLGDEAETVNAVSTFAEFSNAHADLDTLVHVQLTSGSENYIHFPGAESGEMAVFISDKSVIAGFYNAEEETLEYENMGVNSDCPDEFAEVFHVEIVNDTGSIKPQIIKFNQTELENISLFIISISHDHED